MKAGHVLSPIAILVSCRFGGPSANPDDYVASDAGAGAALEAGQGSPGDDGGVASTDLDASVAAGDGASPADVPSVDDAADSGAPEASAEGGTCAATVAVCDPVHDTGCNPLQQCDVDSTQTSTATGICVFQSSSEAGVCTMSFVSESCAPRHTCVSGACRALCNCNADCAAGQCCSDTSGPRGFKLCAPCP